MSTGVYSNARIQFVQNGQQVPDPVSRERALVELRQLDNGAYSVRAVDLAKNGEVRQPYQAYRWHLRDVCILGSVQYSSDGTWHIRERSLGERSR